MKVPRHLSYPVGAEVLSAALADAPQRDALTVTFFANAPDVRTRLADDRAVRVLQAASSNQQPGRSGPTEWIERGYFAPTWELTVYAIPRGARAFVRDALVTSGLAAIRDWLVAARTSVWLSGRHSRTILARPDDGTLTIEDEDR